MRRVEKESTERALSLRCAASAARKAWEAEEDALRARWEEDAAAAAAAAAPPAPPAALAPEGCAPPPAAAAAAASLPAAPSPAGSLSDADVDALRLRGNQLYQAGDAAAAAALYEQVRACDDGVRVLMHGHDWRSSLVQSVRL